MYNLGLQQSRQPKPLNAASVLTFHDSVELFLHLACEELHTQKKDDVKFMSYWPLLKEKLPNDRSLGHESQMERLNRLRVNLKHHGIMPDGSEIERARVNVTNFFEDNTPIIFDLAFDKITMTDVMQFLPARDALNDAATLMEQGKYEEALGKIAISFDLLIEDYESRKARYGNSPFQFEDPFPYSDIHFRRINSEMKNFVNRKIKSSIEPMQNAMKIMSLGLDYRRYVKFKLFAPQISKVLGDEGGFHYFITKSSRKYTAEECHFCHDFVIESAIRIQDFDFDIEKL